MSEPQWGLRTATFADPAGNLWELAQESASDEGHGWSSADDNRDTSARFNVVGPVGLSPEHRILDALRSRSND
jgi:hypothetical protein